MASGHEGARRQNALLRVVDARKCLGAGQLLAANIDFRLIPELDPVFRQRLGQIDLGILLVPDPQLELLQDLQDGVRFEGLFQHRQHGQPVLDADVLDVLQHRRAAIAHQLDRAIEGVTRQRNHGLDCVGRLQGNVQEDEVRRALGRGGAHRGAIGKLNRVDAGAMQHQRQELADAGFLVDDVTNRGMARDGFRAQWRCSCGGEIV